jgi:hypothetical protein
MEKDRELLLRPVEKILEGPMILLGIGDYWL